jgi:hypothetical protein
MIICRHVSHNPDSILRQKGQPKHDTFFMDMERHRGRAVANPTEKWSYSTYHVVKERSTKIFLFQHSSSVHRPSKLGESGRNSLKGQIRRVLTGSATYG